MRDGLSAIDQFLVAATVRVVEVSRRRAWWVVALSLMAAVLCGVYASTRLGMNSDLDALLSPELPWRQAEHQFSDSFPQFDDLLAVVVDGVTPDQAEDAAAALAQRLEQHPEIFRAVRRPDGDEFFRRSGLLFLSPEELAETTAKMVDAQPFIGALAADPSLRGLFGTLEIALQGVARGDADFAMLRQPLGAIADTLQATLDGRWQPLSWQTMLTGRQPGPMELRRFVLTQPVLNFEELDRAARAKELVRQTVAELNLTPERGVRVRVTGSAAVESDELQTLADGAALSMTLSFTLVTALLVLGLRSSRLIVPIVITMIVGLILTAAFAAATVHTLNPISVAFAVLFMGMAVDFGIQFATRYREERFRLHDPVEAMRAAAAGVGGALLLAAATTAIGFFSFLPTSYVGVSQLGLIAGGGMVIAVGLNLTLLPALLRLFRPAPEPTSVGYPWMAPVDRLLVRWRYPVRALALVVAGVGLVLVPQLRFDFNPMNLRDPNTESVATALELMGSPDTTPFTIDILAANPAAAANLAERLSALPSVYRALSIESFIPEQQARKLALLEDANLLLGPTLNPSRVEPPPSPAAVRAALTACAAALEALPTSANDPVIPRLSGLLRAILGSSEEVLGRLDQTLMRGLSARLAELRLALSAQPITLENLPASLKHDWLTADGRARIEVAPSGDGRNNTTLVHFVAAVQALAPTATGTAVTIQQSATTIVGAFLQAGAIAFLAITAVLYGALRRWLDVALVMAPLLLATLMTVITCVELGPAINFANIIALPLLLGIGVAFNIYFVVNWRAGLTGPLQSSTARAVLFSALTTTVAFGSLALSDHPGTASMGILLALSLGYTLLTTLLVLPALFSPRVRLPGYNRSITGS